MPSLNTSYHWFGKNEMLFWLFVDFFLINTEKPIFISEKLKYILGVTKYKRGENNGGNQKGKIYIGAT